MLKSLKAKSKASTLGVQTLSIADSAGQWAGANASFLESNTSLACDRIQGWIALHVGDTNKRGSILRDITFCWTRMRARSEFFVTRFPTHQAQPQRRLFETSDTDVPPRFAHA
jgi:hypothetical protein